MSNVSIRTRIGGFSLFLVLLTILVIIPSVCFSQVLENLEIIFQKTYVNGAAPDSLWDWGISIDCAGDVNNDGYDDIIVAANTRSGDLIDPWLGKAYIFLGGSPMDTFPDVILTGSKYGSGWVRVAGIGDFDSDSYDEVILAQDAGDKAVKVFFGGDPMDTIPDVILETRPVESVATSVAGAGDVNGDSIDDCIVGDYLWAGTDGRGLIFFGGSPPDSIPDVIINGHGSEGFGSRVAGGGDLNWDGFDDFVVGAANNSEMGGGAGKIYIFWGGDPVDTVADASMLGDGPSQWLGWDDVSLTRNESDYDWVVTGTSLYPNGFPNLGSGIIYILFGADSMDGVPDVRLEGPTDSCGLGASSGAAHVNSPQWSDIVGGAPYQPDVPGVYLWLGSIPFDSTSDAHAKGDSLGQEPGWLVSNAGDVDNDGNDEIMFSNYAASTEHTVWVAKYKETGIAEGHRTRKPCSTARVLQNHPNPFSGETAISLQLRGSRQAELKIYDTKGSLVRTIPLLGNAQGSSGTFTVRWDGRDDRDLPVPSGVYFVRLDLPEQDAGPMQARKIVLIK